MTIFDAPTAYRIARIRLSVHAALTNSVPFTSF